MHLVRLRLEALERNITKASDGFVIWTLRIEMNLARYSNEGHHPKIGPWYIHARVSGDDYISWSLFTPHECGWDQKAHAWCGWIELCQGLYCVKCEFALEFRCKLVFKACEFIPACLIRYIWYITRQGIIFECWTNLDSPSGETEPTCFVLKKHMWIHSNPIPHCHTDRS